MPTSLKATPVSFQNGQKRINLRAALEIQQYKTSSVEMTFGELARAYLAVHYNGADMQLRKWIDLLDSRSAWDVGVEELALAGIAMIDNGYAPGTVNRNFSQLGSVYRWAKQQRLTPVGFISPTLSQHRYDELMRHIFISDEEVQVFPSRPIEVIVPWGPGGGSDITGRMVAKFLEAELKVAAPVVNSPGASGTIGVQRMLSKPADGYSVVVTGDFYALIGGDAPKWTLDNFVPLGVLINQPGAIFVATESRFKTWADVEREAKAKPGSISLFMAGLGIIDEVHANFLTSKGIRLNVIPVSKPAERYSSILGGHGDLLYEQAGDVKALLEAQKIRPLLSLTEERFPIFKNTPTSKELGYEIWTPQIRWIFARSGTDPARIQVLASALEKMAASEDYKNYLRNELAAPDSFVPASNARAYIQKTLDNVRKEAADAKQGMAGK